MKRALSFIKAVCVMLVMSVLLSACGLVDIFSVDSLIRAPKLTGEDALVQEAFEAAVGTDVYLINPVTGDYRSSFVQYDIDMDGTQETLVFYSKRENSAETHIHFLKFRDDAWVSVGDITGKGSAIDHIAFYNLDKGGEDEIAVTWTLSDAKRTKNLALYKLDGQNANVSVSQLLDLQVYDYTVLDFDFDGQMELMYLYNDSANTEEPFTASIIKYSETSDSGFLPVCKVELSEAIESPEKISYDIKDGQYRLYIDCFTHTGELMTEILYYRYNNSVIVAPSEANSDEPPQSTEIRAAVLQRPTDEKGEYLCEQTRRNYSVYCEDITVDNQRDYFIDIPVERINPGSFVFEFDTSNESPLYYIEYMRYENSALVSTGNSYFFDPAMTFRFKIDRFLGQYSAVYDIADKELRFFTRENLSVPVFSVNFIQFFSADTDSGIVISNKAPEWLTENMIKSLIKAL